VAKKSRTPAPPRRVQAPQRRAERKQPRTGEDKKRLYLSIAFAASGVIAVVLAGVIVFSHGKGNGSANAKVPSSGQLVGLQTGPAPWNAGVDHLPDRLSPLGLHALGAEGEVVHIHQHLDIFVNGKKEPVPQGIGIFDGQFLTELHTHDASGIMHVESPAKRSFDLAQFMGTWGVRFTPDCIGGYCKELTPWHLYVNGKLYSGDPRTLKLARHQELAIVIGTPPAKIPSTYKFAAGL